MVYMIPDCSINRKRRQPLRISVFAFDPDNPGFEPKIRLTPTGPATGPETTAPTVTYQVTGLPIGR